MSYGWAPLLSALDCTAACTAPPDWLRAMGAGRGPVWASLGPLQWRHIFFTVLPTCGGLSLEVMVFLMDDPLCTICQPHRKHSRREDHVVTEAVVDAHVSALVPSVLRGDVSPTVNSAANGRRVIGRAVSIPANVINTPANCTGCTDKAVEIAELRARIAELEKPKPSRKEYMRTYMKKRRDLSRA